MNIKHVHRLALLLALVLCLSLAFSAQATSLALPIPDEHQPFLYQLTGDEKAAYALSMDSGLYRYLPGEKALTRLSPLSPLSRHDSLQGLAVAEGGLHTLSNDSDELLLAQVLSGSPRQSIRLPLARDVKGAGKHSYIRHLVTSEGALWFLLSPRDSDYDHPSLCCYDLKGDKLTLYKDSRGAYAFCLLEGGQVLLSENYFKDNERLGRLKLLDTKSGQVSQVAQLPDQAGSMAYDKNSQSVLFICQSALWRWQMGDAPQRLRPLPVNGSGMSSPGIIMHGKLLSAYDRGLFLADPGEQISSTLHLIGEAPGGSYQGGVYDDFMVEHPEVVLSYQHSASPHQSISTGELGQRIQTGMLSFDILVVNTQEFDLASLIRKGYCLDLSADAELMEAVQRMHPAIRDQVLVDGQLFGLPARVDGLNTLLSFESSMEALGLAQEDLPGSFEGLIAWLQDWPGISAGQELRPFPVSNTQRLLKDRVIGHYIAQRYAKGLDLDFDEPILVSNLEAIEALRLPTYTEGGMDGMYSLLDDGSHALISKRALCLSQEEGGQKAQPGRLFVYVVNASTENREAALGYLRLAAQRQIPAYKAGLYQDFAGAVEQEDYPQWLTDMAQEEDLLQEALAKEEGGSPGHSAAEERLAAHLARVEAQKPRRQYRYTAEDVAHYQAHLAPFLAFTPLNPFTSYSEPGGEAIHGDIQRYLKGQLSARQLADLLSQKARLMRLEGE